MKHTCPDRVTRRWRPAGPTLLLALGAALGPLEFARAADTESPPEQSAAASLGGTSWQLVRFRSGDDTTLMPDERAKYTIAFDADGNASVRADCNRGRATWKSPDATRLEFGPPALTRAMCPPGSMHDRFVKDLGTDLELRCTAR